jgi:hypothetical protein
MSIDFILPRLLRGCGSRLEDYARQASAQGCPKLQEDFLVLERRWLFLAHSYELTERLCDFSDETKRNVDKFPKTY